MENKFRVIFSIIKSDMKGKVLKRLANSNVCVFGTIELAVSEIEEVIDLAQNISTDAKFACYGVASVINKENGDLVYSRSIK